MTGNQTVLITGASSGIGRDLAVLFAEQHYNLVLVARSELILQDLAQQLEKQHNIVSTVIAKDLSELGAAKVIFDVLKQKNIVIDILINNAGFGTYGEFHETPLAETQNMLAVNITALTELTYLLLPGMLVKKSGKIMNVSSLAAFQACPYMAVYAATKAYVLSFSEALTEELKGMGVSVTSFCPGVTLTGFQERTKTQNTRIVKNQMNTMTSKQAAEIAFAAMMRNKPFVISGVMNNILAVFAKWMPRRMNAKLAGYLMRLERDS